MDADRPRFYDPQGKYIKRWVPELRDVDPVKFMNAPEGRASIAKNYPLPMLDHAAERDAALEMFRQP